MGRSHGYGEEGVASYIGCEERLFSTLCANKGYINACTVYMSIHVHVHVHVHVP